MADLKTEELLRRLSLGEDISDCDRENLIQIFQSYSHLDVLADALSSSNEEVVEQAVYFFSEMGSAAERLVDHALPLTQHDNPDIRLAAVEGLIGCSEMLSVDAVGSIFSLIQDPDEQVRAKIVSFVINSESGSFGKLVQVASETSPDSQRLLSHALSANDFVKDGGTSLDSPLRVLKSALAVRMLITLTKVEYTLDQSDGAAMWQLAFWAKRALSRLNAKVSALEEASGSDVSI